jgi:hypothetical protein
MPDPPGKVGAEAVGCHQFGVDTTRHGVPVHPTLAELDLQLVGRGIEAHRFQTGRPHALSAHCSPPDRVVEQCGGGGIDPAEENRTGVDGGFAGDRRQQDAFGPPGDPPTLERLRQGELHP